MAPMGFFPRQRQCQRRLSWIVVTAIMFISMVSAHAADVLEPDAAFQLSAHAEAGQIRLRWKIAEGHYLYRSRVSVQPGEARGVSFNSLEMPAGKKKQDEFFGEVEVYHHDLEALLPYTGDPTGPVTLGVTYQGCAERGICYPPQTRYLQVDLVAQDSARADSGNIGKVAPSQNTDQDRVLEMLADGNAIWVMLASQDSGYCWRSHPACCP